VKATRRKPEKHWRNMGAFCARLGRPVEAALTRDESVNALIREGYDRESKHIAKRDGAKVQS
jgi:hypothetical protein